MLYVHPKKSHPYYAMHNTIKYYIMYMRAHVHLVMYLIGGKDSGGIKTGYLTAG